MSAGVFMVGDRVIFRKDETGPAEPAVVAEVVGPTESHPSGGEFVVLFDCDGPAIRVFHTELTHAAQVSA